VLKVERRFTPVDVRSWIVFRLTSLKNERNVSVGRDETSHKGEQRV
jgi:hypothetical protein